ncbi:hypothetical protein Ddc_12688 [Ditylenchus destructor]|nr:hypothetical protein Ddc_12688 [Ditylenchus destructor]
MIVFDTVSSAIYSFFDLKRVRNQSENPDSPEPSNVVASPPHIKRAQRSNSAHALAGSMYAIRQPFDQNLVNRFAKNDGRQSTYDDGNAQYHCNCRHCGGGGLTSACLLQPNMEISYHPDAQVAPRAMHHSYSSRSLPRRKDSRPNSLYQPPAGNCAFPTQNNQHDNFQSPYADHQLYRDNHAQPQPIDQNQTQPNSEPQVGSVPSDMFFGTADRRKKPTPMGASHPMNGNAPGRSALNSSFIGNTPLSPVNYVGHPVYPQQQQSTFPAHKENVYDNPTHFSTVRDHGHETASHASTTVSSSSGTIGSSSVENYFYGTAPGNRSTAEENVFNATANFSPDTLSHSSTPVGTSTRMKSKSSNKLNLTSVLGRHSKATTPVANQDPSFGTPDHWPIDHPNHAKAMDSYEKSLVLYGHAQPTVTSPTVNQPGCSNGYGMSRSSSTQGFVGKEYFESPQMYATNHMMDHSEAVRRSTSNHNDLTEPIVVLAKQVASKEVEIDRLKSQLNRRSSRAENQRAQFEDELAAQRREADYNREQASKLKTKLRQTETECATAKAKKEELEKKLESLTSTYEQKIEAMEKENVQQRKEYARMRELEEAYEKYIDEKDWLEKQSESLNHKLDEHESSLHLSEQECHQLKLEIERLQDCLKEKEQEIHELTLLSATNRLDIVDSDSEDGGENYEEENLGVRKSLKEAKRRANGKQKTSVETGIRKPSRPNLLLNPASSSSAVIQPHSRSSSSTPDSSAAPPSVSSSGVSSFGGGKLSAYEPSQFSVGKHLSRCQRKLQVCQKKLNSLLETTQRIQSGGKPTKQDILGSASESDADFMDFEHLANHNEKAMDKALEEHFAQISRLYQNIEKLHGSLLAVYGRSRAQTNDSSKDPCRMQ